MFLVMVLVLIVKKITLTNTKKTAASRNMSWVIPVVKTAAINNASVIKIIAIVEALSILMCNIKVSSPDLLYKFYLSKRLRLHCSILADYKYSYINTRNSILIWICILALYQYLIGGLHSDRLQYYLLLLMILSHYIARDVILQQLRSYRIPP